MGSDLPTPDLPYKQGGHQVLLPIRWRQGSYSVKFLNRQVLKAGRKPVLRVLKRRVSQAFQNRIGSPSTKVLNAIVLQALSGPGLPHPPHSRPTETFRSLQPSLVLHPHSQWLRKVHRMQHHVCQHFVDDLIHTIWAESNGREVQPCFRITPCPLGSFLANLFSSKVIRVLVRKDASIPRQVQKNRITVSFGKRGHPSLVGKGGS